jgi:DNA-binding IclR family transcriptional regulator
MSEANSVIGRCLGIIEMLADGRNMPLADISRELDIPKSATHRLLQSLAELGWVKQVPESGYYGLTLRLAIAGQRLLVGTRIPEVCQPVLDRLARESADLVRLAVVQDGTLTTVAFAQGGRVGLIYQPEMIATVPLHCSATGKAWLATLPNTEAVRLAVRQKGFGTPGVFGPRALLTVETLIEALEETRQRGWASVWEENEVGIAAVAAAIRPGGKSSSAVGAVSIAGPLTRYDKKCVAAAAERVIAGARELAELWPLRSSSPDAGRTEPPLPLAARTSLRQPTNHSAGQALRRGLPKGPRAGDKARIKSRR